jgi:hypothetical protein
MYKNRSITRGTFGLGFAALALSATVASASAQSVDARWLPWVGCWEPVETETGTNEIVCVRPTDQAAAVEVVRFNGSEALAREVLWADGAQHETAREGCDGWERGSFSADMRRVFLASEHTCEGGAVQDGAATMAITGPDEWLDIRVMGMGDERMAWVQRFRLIVDQRIDEAGFGDVVDQYGWSAATSRLLARAPLDVDDVIEAHATVPTEAVEALLAERADPLELSAAELIRMSDAGVPDHVIDIAVATSYPEKFQVAAGGPRAQGPMARGYRSFMSPFFFDPFYSPYSLRYGFNSFYGGGYGYYGGYGYGYGYGYRPTTIVVDRVDRDHGRVLNGRGYSRTRSGGTPSGSGRSGVRSSGGGASGGSAARSGGSSSTRKAKPRGGGGSSSSFSRSGAASGGSAAKSGASSSTRKAKPRGGGGV